AAGIVAVLLLAALPGRARNATAFAIVGLGVLVGLSQLLDVGDAVRNSADAASVLHAALWRIVVGTVLALLATGVWLALERRVPVGDPTRARAARLGGLVLAGVAALAVTASVAGVGPVTVDKVQDAASSITKPYEAESDEGRLSAGLNSGRWDFWTVAWEQFELAPVVGAGADNYRQDYLLWGTGSENPRYPHSMWLRSLGQLGIVGTLLLLGWVLAVFVAIRRLGAMKDPAARGLALASGGAFGMWVVHGSADWIMEYGGLSAIVAAVAGLAVAAGPQARIGAGDGARRGGRSLGRTLVLAGAGAALGVAALWTAGQWVADRDRLAAVQMAGDRPIQAVDRAQRADALEPFGEQADMILGALAVQRGDLPAAREAYLRAYARNPRAARPRMWLGVVASAQGDQREARRWLRRAARAAPRDALVAELAERVARGEVLDPRQVQLQLSDRTQALVRDPDPGVQEPAESQVAPGAAPLTPEFVGPPFPGG
ncbi:MAG: O-antigen ligase family protein, partial [Solirubrobacteraceae bacterium]|nr:O-antigen ligase family protein [Solirubrobacteraceae bacterium]